jgi:iron complex outermembrane receptor protein
MPPPGSRFSDPLIEEEKLRDYELGASVSSARANGRATLYLMDFRDEIVDSGALDRFGRPITSSAARSTHRGIELEGVGRLGRGFQLAGYLTLSDDTFDEHTEHVWADTTGDGTIDGTVPVDRSGNRIANFPDSTARLTLSWSPSWGALELGGRHVGRVFIDNSQDRNASLDPYAVFHLDARYNLPLAGRGLWLRLRVNNLLDAEYEPGGHLDWYTGGPRFIPAAGRNVFLMLSYRPAGR